ncbi:hypothetical protein [Fibrobacter intestinalis]|uniref:Uncharacterized protein n=1 Tax=Fibrobacter intestinalis TaxID=28122 RepID=A0A1T4Q1I4_9BACT|nr:MULTISPECIES: hypothetical protein [Fibrobacter]PBC72937.1 hypothetical protein BGW94_0522 [Fibrobacter sp. NR9]SJZ97690.1 hypothetical protein SAMN02745108_02134 [Fibrobacter intestinalis]
MTNTAKFRINAEEIRLTNNRRMLIAGMNWVTERLENRRFALSASEVDRLNRPLENIQNRLAEINDRLMDIQIQKREITFRVSFPNMEKDSERKSCIVWKT